MTTDTKLSASCAAQPSAQAARLGSGRELRSLYDVTGDVKDINTVLLSRDDYRALQPTPVDRELVPVEPHLDPQTPEQAPQWYAAGYHPDHIHPVWNGCKVRPSDNGIVAPDKLKSTYKGDSAITLNQTPFMTNNQIARVCHEVNRAYCQALGDNSQPTWEDAPQWQRDSALLGVQLHLTDPDASAAASHESWMAQKIAEGWVWGPNKNPELKQHYCIVPFELLPVAQQAKDFIFRGVVHALRGESQTTQPSTWKLAPVTWSEPQEPNERIRYTHVVAETALGTFTIQWKGWKENDSPCVYLNGEYLSTEPTIEAAKAWVTKHLQKIVNGLVVTEQPAQPRLKVWLTSFPESNGKTNWTALLTREEKWDGLPGNAGGITLDRGEMWNRVAYEAERTRFLLGQRDTEPYILDYGDDVKTPEEWKGELLGPVFNERKQARREERSRAKAQADAESKTE